MSECNKEGVPIPESSDKGNTPPVADHPAEVSVYDLPTQQDVQASHLPNVTVVNPTVHDPTTTPLVASPSSSNKPPDPRYIQINGELVRVIELYNGLDVSANWDPILPEEDLANPLFLEMTKTSQTNLNKKARVDMLYSFIENGTHLSHWLHANLKKYDTLQALNGLLEKTYQSRYATKLYPLALKLFQFNKLLNISDGMRGSTAIRAKSRKTEVMQIRVFRDWVEKLNKKMVEGAMKQSGKRQSRKKGKSFQQPSGMISKYPISVKVKRRDPKWHTKREVDPCPACGHNMIIFVEDPVQLATRLKVRVKEYEHAMAKWESEGSKPKKSQCNLKEQQIHT